MRNSLVMVITLILTSGMGCNASQTVKRPYERGVFELKSVVATGSQTIVDDSAGTKISIADDDIVNIADIDSVEKVKDNNGAYQVLVKLSPNGTKKLLEYTKDHIGQKLAEIVGGKFMVAPVIHEPIKGGQLMVGQHLTEIRADEIVKILVGSK